MEFSPHSFTEMRPTNPVTKTKPPPPSLFEETVPRSSRIPSEKSQGTDSTPRKSAKRKPNPASSEVRKLIIGGAVGRLSELMEGEMSILSLLMGPHLPDLDDLVF
jgi:hypothetical protein